MIDFDGAMLGDPYWEIAHFITFLKKDVPWCRDCFVSPGELGTKRLEQAQRAYRKGYEEGGPQALDEPRLAWFRIASEIQYLARSLQRDLLNPVAFARTFESIRNLCRQLS